MNENEIMNKQIEEIKESVINKVRNLFGKAKDDLKIKEKLDRLINEYISNILKNNDKDVQKALYESLEPVYNLDKNLDEKENIFKDILNYGVDSRREEVINTDNDDLRYKLVGKKSKLFDIYSEEKDKISKKEKAEQDEYFTHAPEFKSRVRQILERKGIQNEDVIYEIENRVKNTVGHIYEDYNEADKSISNNLEEICDEELGKYEQQVTTSRQDIEPESKRKNDFTNFLQAGVNSEEKIGETDMGKINNEGEPNKDDLNKDNKKYSLPDNVLY